MDCCNYCNKNKHDDVLCCIWAYYANNKNANLVGFDSWYKNNKAEINNIINEEKIKYELKKSFKKNVVI